MSGNRASSSGKGNVLLVDDDLLNQLVTGKSLSAVGFQVTTVGGGLEALRHLHDKAFDVVLMDIQMPGMDGYETTRNIRTSDNPQIRNLPIIACTGSSEEEIKGKCAIYGINAYVIKPYSTEDLLRKINQFACL